MHFVKLIEGSLVLIVDYIKQVNKLDIRGKSRMNKKILDYKKEYKDLYMPKDKPTLIVVPSMNFIMCDGTGDPHDNSDFQQAIGLLYGLSFTIKMSKKMSKNCFYPSYKNKESCTHIFFVQLIIYFMLKSMLKYMVIM